LRMYLTIFGKPRYLGSVEVDDELALEKGARLLIESSRGVETAVVAGELTEKQETLYRSIDNHQDGQPNADAGLRKVTLIRLAEAEDLRRDENNRIDEDQVLVKAREVLCRHALNMKLVDVEYMNDRKKLFLYFTSEQRVDFRAYVRDLAREFKTRIELRQIGVRDEAKVVKGLGACGRVCCCSYWLQRFMPIGIKMVKEQNLALNPAKISGLCGRLMCCMSFEQGNYHELWKGLPSHGAKIKTADGTWVLSGVDLATGTCSIHGPMKTVNIPVKMYPLFKETLLSGKEWSNEEHHLDEKGLPLAPDDCTERCACPGSCGLCSSAPEMAVEGRNAAAPREKSAEVRNEAQVPGRSCRGARGDAENLPPRRKNRRPQRSGARGDKNSPAPRQNQKDGAAQASARQGKETAANASSMTSRRGAPEGSSRKNFRFRRSSRPRGRRTSDGKAPETAKATVDSAKGQR
jgi:cell fate regulator YaaT (PSP1 superfamily)